MRPKQHLFSLQTGKLVAPDRPQSQLFQPFHFLAIVYDISEAIQRIRIFQFAFCTLDSRYHAKTKAGTLIYLDFYHIYNIINKQALTVFLIFNHKKLKFLHNKTRVFQ